MPIVCEVIPRKSADPQELKALGTALLRWYVQERESGGVAHSLDTEALIQLLNGRLPPTFPGSLRSRDLTLSPSTPPPTFLGGYEVALPNLDRLREALEWSAQPVAIVRVRRWRFDRERAVASLRTHIPAHLVEDIRVDGKSWNAEAQAP